MPETHSPYARALTGALPRGPSRAPCRAPYFWPKKGPRRGLSAYSVRLLGGLSLDPDPLFLRGTSGKTF